MNLKLSFFASLAAFIAIAFGGRPVAAAESTRFERDILPVFYHHCFGCHSEKQAKPKGKLRLDTAEAIRGSEVIVPGKPDESELFKRVSLPHGDEGVMPPLKGGAQPLNDAERAMVRRWIADGAKLDSWVKFDHRGPAIPAGQVTPPPGDVRQLSAELQKRVDQFHAARGTKLNPPADDEVFLRRVYVDVIGRIPTLEESGRFLASKDDDRRAKLITELLNSEGYVSHMFNWKADLLRVNSRGLAAGQPGMLYDDWVKDAIRSHMPYDQFVRELITAKGYLWKNGAVGFYVRDLGMPLDHMSNMTRVFLGTRIECAQCHDHPLEPITQRDFYQMTAFTFGVSNLGKPGGYSPTNVKQWPELKARLAALHSDKELDDSVSQTIAPLKRLTADTEMHLKFPEAYPYDASLRGRMVEPRTLFGDEAVVTDGDRRKAFADWMTSPRNPRFARNIANRLWKRVMGAGLIEPVDSLSALPNPQHGELVEFLGQAMVRLRFDERAFIEMLLNTRLYQSQTVRETPEPGVPFALLGPQLRRLSAEQIWDSHLVLLAPDIDQRKSTFRYEGPLATEHLRKLAVMTADEIIAQARLDRAAHTRMREASLRRAEQLKELAAARDRGDEKEVKRLNAAYAKEKKELAGPGMKPEAEPEMQDADPRWRSLPPSFIRASETPLPLPLGHFLRQFGQSDRREIDAFNRDPNTTHSLALMNGDLTSQILKESSLLRRQLAASKAQGDARTQLIFRAILVRSATADDIARLNAASPDASAREQDTIWALLNSPEFLFNQ
ncbi:DUF1549 domain-containing protein [Humisphaera borealis]|uniref:DUF1549 domain-containing protein n=1 Tax=Humisphaera borealis TaxID=2807512 RepID=A0A7M2X0C9_9BACT|nr:DUF1549 domain-containing protein [Humisphaera borealis]QOV91218.1 DUF1549 domain-containing protein [Humisphaera borealis]